MPKYVVNDDDFEVIPEDDYIAEFSNITAKTSYFTNDAGDEEVRRYYSWEFTIRDDEEFSGRKVFVNVSDRFGLKSKQRKMVEKMLGRKLENGEEFEVDSLIGGVFKIDVEHVHKDDRTFANVASAKQVKKRRGGNSSGSKKTETQSLKARQKAAEEAAAAKSDEDIDAEADEALKAS